MKIEAFGDYVFLKPMTAPEKRGGIMLPEVTRAEMQGRAVGEVVSVGPLVNEAGAEHTVEKGDVFVYWDSRTGGIHGIDGLPLRFCKKEFLCGKVLEDVPLDPATEAAHEARMQRLDREVRAMKAGAAVKPSLAIAGKAGL